MEINTSGGRREGRFLPPEIISRTEFIPDPVMELDAAGTIFYLNRAARTSFPDIGERTTGHPYLAGWEITAGTARGSRDGTIVREVATGGRWYRQLITHLAGENAFRVHGTDITAYKKTEEELKLRATLLDAASDTILLRKSDGNFAYVNEAATRLYGYSRAEFMKLTARDILAPESSTTHRGMIDTLVETGIVQRETVHIRKDGSAFTADVHARVIHRADGDYFLSVLRDISERKRAENAISESERRFRDLIENLPVGIVVATPDGRAVQRNRYTRDLYGYTGDRQGTQAPVANHYFDPGDRTRFLSLLEKGPVSNFEVRLKRDDGTLFWASISSIYFLSQSGEKQILTTIQDISERKRAQESLRASEEKYRTLVDNLPLGVSVTRLNGQAIERNLTSQRLYGYDSKEEFMAVPTTDLYVDLEDRKRFFALLSKGPVKNFEHRRKRRDGSIFWASFTALLKDSESGEKQVITIIEDITLCKQAEDALKASESRFRTLVENAPVGISIGSPDGRITYRNRALAEMSGYSDNDILNRQLSARYFDPDERERFIERLKLGTVKDFEARIKRKGGEYFWASISSFPYLNESGEKQHISIILDITARKQAEEALKASEANFRNLIRDLPVGIAVVAENGSPIQRNTYLRELFRYEAQEHDLTRPVISNYFNPEDRARFVEKLKKGPVHNFEARMRRNDGTVFWASLSAIYQAQPSGERNILSVFQDITERKQVERMLKLSQEELRNLSVHLQSIREDERTRIAREIHDELGQALTAVKFDAAWIRNHLPEGQDVLTEKAQALIRLVDDTADRVKQISSDLRPGLLDDFGLAAAADWQAKRFSEQTGIRCAVDASEDLDLPRDLSTVLFRILQESLTNVARHARASRVNVILRQSRRRFTLKIKDNGRGISREELENSSSLGIIGMRERVHALGGEIEWKGGPGRGTTVTVSVPVKKAA